MVNVHVCVCEQTLTEMLMDSEKARAGHHVSIQFMKAGCLTLIPFSVMETYSTEM